MTMQTILCYDQNQNTKIPTFAEADQSRLGVHCIAENCGASLYDQRRF